MSVSDFCLGNDPLGSPAREAVEAHGFVHSFPTNITTNTNCFEVIFEMIEDDVMIGKFALFYHKKSSWIAFDNELTAVSFRLRA